MPRMTRLASFAAFLLLASAGCESSKSKLDGMGGAPAESPGASAVDRSGDLETRLRRVEDKLAKHAEALDFLDKVYAQQKAQQQAQQREEHAPDAVFAVNIDQNVKLGHVEGPANALVTIVEAWDFA